jgi:Ca2+:H+ antiporter
VARGSRPIASARVRPVFVLGVFVPIAAALHFAAVDSSLVFAASALAIVPMAALMGDATEQLSARAGPGVGGLVNVTFGNAPELIIAIFALADGLQEVVKASLVGSILGNCLLVLGGAMFAGGLGRVRQRFSPTAAQALAGMVLVAVVALALPSTLALARHLRLPSVSQVRHGYGSDLEAVSIAVSVVLACTYLAGLVFSLRTHRDLFNPAGEHAEAEADAAWPARRSVAVLAGAGVLVALMSELLVGSIEHAAHQIGVSQFFLSAYVVAIVGNAAEHYVAVSAAVKDKMDLSLNIALGSSVQIGLFVTPLLVLLSLVVGPNPMALVFNPYEIAALLAAGLVSAAVVSDGESTWFEGLALVALYLVIGIVFYAA